MTDTTTQKKNSENLEARREKRCSNPPGRGSVTAPPGLIVSLLIQARTQHLFPHQPSSFSNSRPPCPSASLALSKLISSPFGHLSSSCLPSLCLWESIFCSQFLKFSFYQHLFQLEHLLLSSASISLL